MADDPTNLVLEHLRHIRAGVDAMDIRLDELTGRVGRIEQVLVTLVQSYADVNKHLDRSDERLSRIERRLDLASA